MRNAVSLFIVLLAAASRPAAAQPKIYVGGTVAVDGGNHAGFDLGPFPAAGGLIGVRFNESWSLEVHVDRGFARSPERDAIEIFGHSTVQNRAGVGRAIFAVWTSPRHARLGLAVTMGVATRSFSTHRLSIVKTDPSDPYPVQPGLKSTDAGAGWSGGVLVPMALGGRWSLAPEFRMTFGVTGESGGYAQVYPAVRVMWGF